MARQLARDDYTIGWVCALAVELTAAQEMLDEEHQDLPQDADDINVYTLGRIGKHNIVLAALPAGLMGIASATAVAQQMRFTFRSIRFGLMVGIGGGVPSTQADIRLGDVVVSLPEKGHGGVIQYDFGKATPSGFEPSGFLNAPPPILLAAVTKLRAAFDRGRSLFPQHLARFESLPKFVRESAGDDVLFEADYVHQGQQYDCTFCKADRLVLRQPRDDATPLIHYGTVACGNQVIRDGQTREMVSSEFNGVLCFEMEAAGLMNNTLPCLVIRGICDYADSHKTKKWQPYASAAAAAFAKDLLSYIPLTLVPASQSVKYPFQGTSTTNPVRKPGGLSDQERHKTVQSTSNVAYSNRQIEALLGGMGQWCEDSRPRKEKAILPD
ncbi:hypothetical protein NW762_011690 [Fusarium torreyae]|uniref:Nucleoside phosphorylase domain-containing protein n=1 Tax=Fusarium torreyae TaxID=1237075 RepID=A0A9W8VAE1_9HYPO|nr:hypothetical protein NW762_011690 [Fusarium torreyae]